MGRMLEFVVAHEVGHTLGFQHNMKASSLYPQAMMRDKEWVLVSKSSSKFDARALNFSIPDARNWYTDQYAGLMKYDIAGWWDDEGEASYTTYYYWNLAQFNATEKFKPGKRLWTINRAFQPGLQRFGVAAWTGDISAKWDTLETTPVNLLNWSLAGMPYGACDIGGFLGHPSPEMLTRWMEMGVFLPVMRAHSDRPQIPHFPWLFGPDAEIAIRNALDLRYRLIPYYYSLAHEAHLTGYPLMRPLVMEFQNDPKVANLSDEWLMGSGLLAAPILTASSTRRSVYLPAGNWYRFDTNEKINGSQTIDAAANLDQIPAYVHEGTILPLSPVIQSTSQLPGGPLEVQIYPGKDATFALVEDDGETTAYLKGNLRRTTFSWNDASRKLTWTVTGDYSGKDVFKTVRAIVFDSTGKKEAATSLNSEGSLTFTQ